MYEMTHNIPDEEKTWSLREMLYLLYKLDLSTYPEYNYVEYGYKLSSAEYNSIIDYLVHTKGNIATYFYICEIAEIIGVEGKVISWASF